jgi:hypothetical protein
VVETVSFFYQMQSLDGVMMWVGSGGWEPADTAPASADGIFNDF